MSEKIKEVIDNIFDETLSENIVGTVEWQTKRFEYIKSVGFWLKDIKYYNILPYFGDKLIESSDELLNNLNNVDKNK